MVSERWVTTAEGVRLHLNIWDGASDNAPFLLVHGLASNARLWDGVAAHLSDAGHKVVAVDQRGHGRSDKPPGGYDFASVTTDLVAVIDRLALDRPVAVGQSWGGNVVLELGARSPDAIRGVACVDGGVTDMGERFPTWEECEARLAPPRTAGRRVEAIESMLRRAHSDWPESGIQGALACFEIREDGTVAPWLSFENHIRILRSLWEQRPSALFPRVSAPVLLMPAVTPDAEWTRGRRREVEAAEALLPRSRTHWFTADHDVHAQYPDQVAAVLLDAVRDGFFT